MKVLIIEDDPQIVETIKLCIQLRWPTSKTKSVLEGKEGIESIKSDEFDIVLLDINLPDISGFEVLQEVRSFSDVPILIITVRDSEDDIIWGLENGADDYIVKPFKPRDLTARINAIYRRTNSNLRVNSTSITRGNLTFDFRTNKVTFGEDVINLSKIEGELLYTLMQNADKTISSKQITEEIWSTTEDKISLVRTHIKRLRDKLRDNPPRIILSDHGGGYKFVVPG